jgi:integrase
MKTVADLWRLYQPVSERDNDSWRTEAGRAAHLVRHLGARPAADLSLLDVDAYRAARMRERTHRGTPPAPATLDREVELLKRIINYAVACRLLGRNPIADVKLLGRANTRKSVVDDRGFDALYGAAAEHLRPVIVTAYDTGCRLNELLGLRWDQVDLDAEHPVAHLHAGETKNDDARDIYLTPRAEAVLRDLRAKATQACPFVFVNPRTGGRYRDVRKSFASAASAAGRPELWFHDLRRSFVTRARRRGIPESVVMRMSGHKTNAVFKRYNIVEDKDVQEAARLLGRTP